VRFPINEDAVRILDEQADGGEDGGVVGGVNKVPLFITIYMNMVSVYGREGEGIPLRAWWLIGSSILAPLAVRKPEPANAARPLRKFCDRHFVN
jgi:hypothetical protein